MAMNRTTVVGVFHDRDQADTAIQELQRAGFADDDIGYAIRNGGAAGPDGAGDLTTEETTAGGAATGALTGGLLGGLIGAAAALLVPGVGPVIAGGILASALGGAAIGAAAGGLLGALTGLGVPEEEARYYEGEFQAGRAVVTVRADSRHALAQEILTRYGAYNVGGPAGTTTALAGESTSRAGAMTGAVQAETESPQAILTSVGEDRRRMPGTTEEIASQAHVAQGTIGLPPQTNPG